MNAERTPAIQAVMVVGLTVAASALTAPHALPGDEEREMEPAQREIRVENGYLHLPVKNGAPMRRLRFVVDGKTAREFEIELAEGEPDFRVFSDVSAFVGQRLTIEAETLPPRSRALESIVQADAVPAADELYRERHRPQFHFSSRRGWNNDPNGLVYYEGEYHLFYQHNPYGWNWGNMHWGHAVSMDLVHWRELPIALYPRAFGDWCFSGSAIVDRGNSAGFRTGDEDVIVAAFTSTGRGECIAYSNDRGRTFTDYERNPVVEHNGRDPKVIWYAPGRHWAMAVYDEQPDSRGIAFYTSSDLKHWERQSRIEGYYECPEIFELPVDGSAGESKWVVYSGDGDYAVGSFDGKTFVAESGKQRYNFGNCFYASQTFNDIPPEDGRRIQIGWGTVSLPGMPFNQMMTFPVELTLRTTEEGLRLFAWPVREIEALRGRKHEWANEELTPGRNVLADIAGDLFDIRAEFEVGDAAEMGLTIRGVPVTYDVREGQLSCEGKSAPLKPMGSKVRLRLLVDRTSIEVFGNDGRIYMPIGVIPSDDSMALEVFSRGGVSRAASLEVCELKSAWR
jgi:fructan beta-fructosidase